MKDWLMELCPEIAEWQAEIIAEQVRIRVESEREVCAKLCDEMEEKAKGTECCKWPTPIDCAEAIRARGEN